MKFRFTCDSLIPADDEAVSWFASLESGDEVDIEARQSKTKKQRSALHVYFRELAKDFNAAGIDRRSFPWREGVELPWCEETVKADLWKPYQRAAIAKCSTEDLDRPEVGELYERFAKRMAELTGVTTAFPEREAA